MKNKIEVDLGLEDSIGIRDIVQEEHSLSISNDVAFGLDVRTFLDKAYKGCITDELKVKGSVSTAMIECNSVHSSTLMGADLGFFEFQYLSR